MGLGDSCQVKLGISHHSLNAARDQITLEKALVFVVEPPKNDDGEDGGKRKKKKNKSTVTMNSFGNGLSINKFKGVSTFIVGFRCRLDTRVANQLLFHWRGHHPLAILIRQIYNIL